MKRFNTLLFTSFFLFGMCIYTQWLPDLKLTTIVNYTYSLQNNAKQVAAYGNTVHTVWYDRPDGNYEIYYRRSTDAGVTWGAETRITNASSNSEKPGIVAIGDFVHIAWCDLRDGDWGIYYKRSTDGGLSWGADQRLSDQPSNGFDPCLAGTGNLLHIVWHDSRNGTTSNGYETYYKRSTDAGITWGPDIRLTNNITNTLYPSISVSGQFVHIVWYDTPVSQQATYYMRSTDAGLNFNTEIRLSSNAGAANWPCISSSGEFVHVVWLDTRDGNYEIYYKRSSDNGINWDADTRLTNTAPNSWYPNVDVSGQIVHVVWWDQLNVPVGNNEIYYKRSTDAGTSWETDIRLTNDDSYSRYTSVAASGQGAHVVWCDYRDGIGIWYKNNPIGNTLIAIDSVSPRNKVNVPLTSDMKAYFNQNMNASTFDSSSIIFFGSMTGRKRSTFTYNTGEKSVSINPNFDFKYGELISTILKSSIKTGNDNFITPLVWSFTTLTNSSNSVFNRTDTVIVGNGPTKISAGDLDGDGDLDFAVTNGSSNTVSILKNNGSGIFTISSETGVGTTPDGIVMCDIDADGDLDLAVANGASNSVSLLKNNGTGSFVLSSSVGAGDAGGLASGDLDNDGDIDIAVTNRNSNYTSILKNNGTGIFTTSSTIAANSPQGITAGDFDNDGDLDLGIVEYWASRISIFKNDGAGTFTLSSTNGVGMNTDQIVTGDFNNDGDLDLAVTSNFSNISILENNGTGTFTVTNMGPSSTRGITPGDFDGDGYLDLAVNNFGSHTVSILRNSGAGTFILSSTIGASNLPIYITAGDYNNNGVLDLAVTNPYNSMITVLMNLTPPQLLTPVNNSVGNLNALNLSWNKSLGASNYRFQLATDSLFSNIIVNDSTLPGTDSLKNVSGLSPLTWYYWRLNSNSANGSSLWSDVWKFKTQGAPTQVVLNSPANNAINQPVSCTFVWHRAIDQVLMKTSPGKKGNSLGPENVTNYWFELSKDSTFTAGVLRDSSLTDTLKIVTHLSPKTRYYWHVKAENETGWGSFSSIWNFTTTYHIDSVSPNQNKINVPLTSDMKAFFRGSMNSSTMDSSNISFFGSMTGRKRGSITYNSGNYSVQILPNDPFKYGELISTTLDSGIRTNSGNSIIPFVWSFTANSNPSNTVFNLSNLIRTGGNPDAIVSGDFDSDGYLDLAVSKLNESSFSILKNIGAGNFTVTNVGSPNYCAGITAADIDKDGDLDIAVTTARISGLVTVFKNDGTGIFAVSSSIAVGSYPYRITNGDFDCDGDLDLAVPNQNSNSVLILINDGSGTFTVTSSITVGTAPYEIASGDFDSDGYLDLAVTNINSNSVSILMNNGAGDFSLASSAAVALNPYGIFAGDINGDGDLDLVVGNQTSSSVSILSNNGTGIFSASSTIGVGTGPRGITMGDLDGDGDLDIALTNNISTATVKILKNDGTGSFSVTSAIGIRRFPHGITNGDFNNDGVIDLAVAGYLADSVSIIMNLAPPLLISPVNSSIGNLNVLDFKWKTAPGADNYKFQLATDSLFSNLLVNDSALTGTDSIKTASGLNALTWYYWRLNSKSANGTSLWSETWMFKTIGFPFQVTLISPPNNAVNQPVSVNFLWSKAVEQMSPFESKKLPGKKEGTLDAISNYCFEIVTDTISMTNLLRDTTLTDTTKIVSGLLNLTDYFWRVKARGELGWGNYSAWFRFTTIISAPSAPVLVNPANGAIGQNVILTLMWNRLPTAESYRLQVSSDSLFNVLIVNDSTVTDSTRVISGLNPLTYYWWRVNAKNIGGTSVYSAVFKFKTMGAPTQVTLLTPLNNAINQAINLNFVWSRSSDMLAPWTNVQKNGESLNDNESISNYWFELVIDTSSMANLLRDSTLTDTLRTVNGLSYSTTYYWRVKAKNQIGWGTYSVWFKFATTPPPPANVNLTVIPGGFYDVGSGRLNMKDTIRVYLVDSASCLRVDSAKGVIDSITYSMPVSFSNAATGSYYMMVYHRNHLSIASRYSQGIVRGSTVSYDFTTDSTKTFGFNVIKVSTSPVRWAMIPGDGNRDGFVDATDQLVWINLNGLDGYLDADFNGDSFVDATDQLIWITYNGTSIFLPCGFMLDPVTLYPVKNSPDYDVKKGNRIIFEKKKPIEMNSPVKKKDLIR